MPAGGGPVCRRQAELRQKAVVARFERAEAVEQIEAGDPPISCFFQGVRKGPGERHRCDLIRVPLHESGGLAYCRKGQIGFAGAENAASHAANALFRPNPPPPNCPPFTLSGRL